MTDEVYVDDPRLESAPQSSEEESEEVNKLTEPEETEEKESEEPEEAEVDEEESEDADEPGEDAAASDKGDKVPPGVQKRIDQMTWRMREAERRAERYEQAILQGRDPNQQQQTLQRPKRYDYDSDDEFDAAMDKYVDQKAELKARQVLEQHEQRQSQTEIERQQEQALRAFQKAETEFAAEQPDYFDVISGESPLNEDAVRQMLPAESGPKVLYHLHKHPEKAQEIANMPTTEKAVYALGRIEASLAQKPRRETTKAPNPVKTVKGRGKTSKKWRDDMSLPEVEKRLGYK